MVSRPVHWKWTFMFGPGGRSRQQARVGRLELAAELWRVGGIARGALLTWH
jgi:hypothetical protein